MAVPDPEEVKDALRDGGEEYHFRNDDVDIGGQQSGESSVKVSHFVVKRDARGQGIGSTVLEALIEVLREEGFTSLSVEMQATECDDFDDLDAKRDEHGEDWEDPTYEFLEKREFFELDYTDDWQWGLCVTGHRRI